MTLPATLILVLGTAKVICRFQCAYLHLEPGHRRNNSAAWEETDRPEAWDIGNQLQGISHQVRDLVDIFAAQDTRDPPGLAGADALAVHGSGRD